MSYLIHLWVKWWIFTDILNAFKGILDFKEKKAFLYFE